MFLCYIPLFHFLSEFHIFEALVIDLYLLLTIKPEKLRRVSKAVVATCVRHKTSRDRIFAYFDINKEQN